MSKSVLRLVSPATENRTVKRSMPSRRANADIRPREHLTERELKREAKSPFIFVTERGAPFSVSGLAKLIERAGIEAKIPFKVHAHMLRHACGYALPNKGTDI